MHYWLCYCSYLCSIQIFNTHANLLQQQIKELARQYAPDFIAVRQHLHANPELSYKEFETSQYIQQQLTAMGISFETMATTGVVGLIQGKNPNKRIVALRADIDALPIFAVK